MKNVLKLSWILLAAAVVAGCEPSDSNEDLGERLIYMPQASMLNGGTTNEYPVPLPNMSVSNYTLNEETGMMDIILGVYCSGEGKFDGYAVDVAYNEEATTAALETVANAVALPVELIKALPEKVTVPSGSRQTTFNMTVDLGTLVADHADWYDKNILAAVTISNPSKYALNESLSTTIVSITGSEFMEAPEPPAPINNLVPCGDFADASKWTIKNVNSDAVEAMRIKNGQLEIGRTTASDNNYRWICYTELPAPLEAGKWYKMAVKMNVPTPVTWYSRGIDVGFCVFGIDPSGLNDYKANPDVVFYVDTDMEAARQPPTGPLHGTQEPVNFPTVCTSCKPVELKTNGGIFQAVEGQKWVGFYLRQRNTLVEMNTFYFDDVMVYEVEEPVI